MSVAKNILQPQFLFDEMRRSVLKKLSTELSSTLEYHSYDHTINVEQIAQQIALEEGLNEQEINLVRTAALYHDIGFIHQHEHNEELAIKIVKADLPQFLFSKDQIQLVCDMIYSTQVGFDVQNKYDKIISDADHDYFGREDYFHISDRLRKEYAFYGQEFAEMDWLDFQIDYLENKHVYWTKWAITNRKGTKKTNIAELKRKKKELQI